MAPKNEPACKEAAVQLADKLVNSLDLSIADTKINTKDANEKEVTVVKTLRFDAGSGFMLENTQWKIRYAAVNREVGFNMEGEWEATATVNTEGSESGQCEIRAFSASMSLPK